MLHYAFTYSADGSKGFCREGYANADAVKFHIENVGPSLTPLFLDETTAIATFTKLEVHGPKEELDQIVDLPLF